MKNGMAIRVNTETPVKVRCAPVVSISPKSRATPPAMSDEIAIAMQIGTPSTRSRTMPSARIKLTVAVIS